MGLFGGGSKKPKPPPMPQLSAMGKWAQARLYPALERAIQGGGLAPSTLSTRLSAYRRAYPQVQNELESYLNRFVPRGDVKVRGFTKGALGRAYQTTLQGLKEQEKLRPYEEQQEAIASGFGALGVEKQMAVDITSMYNQQQQQNWLNQQQYGTFGSNLASGLGAAGGWMMAGQRYAQMFSDKPGTGISTTPISGGQQWIQNLIGVNRGGF